MSTAKLYYDELTGLHLVEPINLDPMFMVVSYTTGKAFSIHATRKAAMLEIRRLVRWCGFRREDLHIERI